MSDLFGSFSFSSELSLRWGMTLLHFLWQGALIGLLAFLLTKCVRQATGRYWVNAIAVLACPVAILITFSCLQLPQQVSDIDERSAVAGSRQTLLSSQIVLGVGPKSGLGHESPSARPIDTGSNPLPTDSPTTGSLASSSEGSQAERSTWLPVVARWLTTLYLVGALFHLLRLGVALWGGHRLRELAVPVSDSALTRLVNQQARQIGLKLVPVVAYCERVAVPVVIGVLRPMILLPASLTSGLSSDEFAAILSHEMAHIRRYDLWMNLFQRLMECVLFFHPVVWILSHRLSAEREICCDDLVVRSGHIPLNYAGALLRMAEICTNRTTPNAATLAATGTSESLLELRVVRLMNGQHTPQLQVSPRGIAGMLLFVVMLAMLVPLMEIPNIPGPVESELQLTSLAQAASTQDTSTKSSPSTDKNPDAASQADETRQQRTEPISVSGTVYGPEGKPLPGAKVYAVSSAGASRKLSDTVSDGNGRYVLKDLELPIIASDQPQVDDHGTFEVFAVSERLGFTWRYGKRFYPDTEPFSSEFVGTQVPSIDSDSKHLVPDSPMCFFAGQKIELDLVFNHPKRVRLRAVDDEGSPIANARVRLWNADPVDGVFRELVASQAVDNLGFGTLYVARVMPEKLVSRTTDSEGWFEFAAMPSNCEFRIQVKPRDCAERMIRATTGSNYESEHSVLYRDGQNLVFPRVQSLTVHVTFADSKQPAPRVWVSGGEWHGKGSDYGSTDKLGQVTLELPPGECKFQVLPEYQTPYEFVDDDSLRTIVERDAENEFHIQLQTAAEVEIHVVDAVTGKPIAGADVWTSSEAFPGKTTHAWRSFQQPTTVRQGAVKSDVDGIIQTYFRPGTYSLGLCDYFIPQGYLPTANEDAVECEFIVGEKSRVTLKLQPVP